MADNPNLETPPFPPLKWDGYFWTARIVLNSWRGFQSRLGAYASQTSSNESDGTARLSIEPPGAKQTPPSPEQANAFRYLLENEAAIRDAIVAAVFEEYPALRQRSLEDGFVAEDDMPVLERVDELKAHIGLSTIHVLRVAKDGVAYVGLEFGCSWDEEHGLGLMTHRDRLVELPDMDIGRVFGADLASEDWVAEADAEATGW
ncbi:MAG: hypothetical protein U0793_12195 [Gemmataceae bacterium]